MKKILGIYLLFHFTVNISQAQKICFEYVDSLKVDIGVKLEFRRNNQSLLFTISKNRIIHDELLITNSDLTEGLKLRKFEFDAVSDDNFFYVLETYIFGSTFGANTFIIIWKDGLHWKIRRDYFIKSHLSCKKGRLCEFEVLAGKNKGKSYHFFKGNFVQVINYQMNNK